MSPSSSDSDSDVNFHVILSDDDDENQGDQGSESESDEVNFVNLSFSSSSSSSSSSDESEINDLPLTQKRSSLSAIHTENTISENPEEEEDDDDEIQFHDQLSDGLNDLSEETDSNEEVLFNSIPNSDNSDSSILEMNNNSWSDTSEIEFHSFIENDEDEVSVDERMDDTHEVTQKNMDTKEKEKEKSNFYALMPSSKGFPNRLSLKYL